MGGFLLGLRKRAISAPLLGWYRKVLPPMSDTEREAIEAGTVWWDAELFSGRPDWEKLRALPRPTLSAEEQAFLDGPDGRALRHARRLADHPRAGRPAAGDLALHQGEGLLRDDHPEGIRRARLLGAGAFKHRHEDLDPQPDRGGDRHGAELARPGRTAAALRHGGSEKPLPAAARCGRRYPLLRADRPLCRIGRGIAAGLRRRLLRRSRRQAHARHEG